MNDRSRNWVIVLAVVGAVAWATGRSSPPGDVVDRAVYATVAARSTPTPVLQIVVATPIPVPQTVVVTPAPVPQTVVATSTPTKSTTKYPDPDFDKNDIPWEEAAKYVGYYKCVQGDVVHINNDSSASFINFDWSRSSFYVVSFNYEIDPDVVGCFIQICGTIRTYKGRPQIILSNWAAQMVVFRESC
jgi:hypothetical protein